MKKQLFSYLFLGIISLQGFAQNQNLPTIDSKSYEKMKQEGRLPLNAVFNQAGSFAPSIEDIKNAFSKKSGGDKDGPETTCGCYVQPDSTYTLAMAPNDDGSTGLLNIPFTFCLYGVVYTNLYINNNGNISFGSPFSTFSSTPFPTSGFTMVAPFWGDVDTRGIGTVKYKITPTAMYINWDNVGYFSMATDKVNTFQLIITDGTDPVLPNGNNIAFCYGDMQWTTGSASGGVNGFGGTPATVGANKGDGVSFIQLGQFDQPGSAYDGPFGLSDGVSWLDNQSFFFNVCNSTNIPPIANFIPAISGTGGGCDSISICGSNDTLLISALFLSPENGQTTTININFNGSPGFTTLNNTPGNPATALIQVVSSPANAGMNTITFTATDNGTPAGVTVVNYNVFVDTTGLANFNPVINGNLEFCEGQNTTLTVSPTTYDSYFWNDGSNGNSIVVDSTGQYWVTANWNGCSKTVVVDVVEHPAPAPVIQGALFTCTSNPTTLYIVDSTGLYTSIVWSNSSTNDSISVLSGTFTVTVTDTNGCIGTSPAVTVTNSTPTVTISGVTPICAGSSLTLTAVPSLPSGASYLWSNGGVNASTVVNSSGSVYVTVSYGNGCSASDTVQITVINPVTSAQSPSICQGDNFTLPGGQVVTQSGTYLDTLVAASGCDSIITTNLNVIPLVDATISSVSNLCKDGAIINLSAATGGGIWSGNGIDSTGQFNPIDAGVGIHQIIYTVSTMCGNADTINVTVNPVPDFSLASLEDTCLSSRGTIFSTIISGTPVFTYLWSRGDNSQHLINVLAGNYALVVTDGNGCSKTEHIIVENISNVCDIIVPNVITPNGDGMNDNLVFINLEFFPKNNLVVFNRWGKKIFEKNGYQNDWNGGGHNDGTYFFILELNDNANTVHKGTLSILK